MPKGPTRKPKQMKQKKPTGKKNARRRRIDQSRGIAQPTNYVCTAEMTRASCLLGFAKIRANPWVELDNICSPAGEAGTYIYQPGYLRGIFNIGTTGNGFVAVNPYCNLTDKQSIFLSSGTYASGGMNVVAGGVTPTAPVTTLSSTTAVWMKTVSAGIRVWNMNAALNTKGSVVIVRTIDNNFENNISELSLLSTKHNVVQPVTPGGSWYNTYQAVGNPLDDKFNTVATAFPGSVVTLAIYISGATAGDTFGYDITLHHMYKTSTGIGDRFVARDPDADRASSYISQVMSRSSNYLWETSSAYLANVASEAFKQATHSVVNNVVPMVAQHAPVPLGIKPRLPF